MSYRKHTAKHQNRRSQARFDMDTQQDTFQAENDKSPGGRRDSVDTYKDTIVNELDDILDDIDSALADNEDFTSAEAFVENYRQVGGE